MAETMTEKGLLMLVKLNLRLTTDALDNELNSLIAEAEEDIERSTGSQFSLSNFSHIRAVVTYCRARFGAGDDRDEALYQSMLAKIGVQSEGGKV